MYIYISIYIVYVSLMEYLATRPLFLVLDLFSLFTWRVVKTYAICSAAGVAHEGLDDH